MQDISIYDKALQFLARREHSEQELIQKLRMRYPECENLIMQSIIKLKEKGYLDDQRFIESRIRHRLAQGYGKKRIADELIIIHGLQKSLVSEALTTHADLKEQTHLLTMLIQKRGRMSDISVPEERQKFIQYCLRRGFELLDIKKALLNQDNQA